MEMAVRSMEMVEMAMEINGDGSGGTSKIHRRWWRSYGTVSGKLPTPLGFSIPRLLIGEEAMSEAAPGLLTPGWHGQGLGHASPV
jgi:hypothetical protein